MDFQRMLMMFQLVDSNFPMGTFAQSFGLETAVQQGRISTAGQLLDYLQHYLIGSVAPMEGRAAQIVYNLLDAQAGDLYDPDWQQDSYAEEIRRLDRILVVQKMARESREGVVKIGRRYLDMVQKLHQLPVLAWYADNIRQKRCQGHPAIVHALLMHGMEATRSEMLLSYLYAALNSQVANGVRLVPLGQTDGQRVLQRLFPSMIEQVQKLEEAPYPTLCDLHASGVMLEVDAMRHERLYSRLFMS